MQFIDLNKTTEDHIKIDTKGQYVAFFHNRSGKLTFELAALSNASPAASSKVSPRISYVK